MTADLIAFLRARLDEDVAVIVAPETWTAFEENERTGTRRVDVDHSIERVVACTRSWRGDHIARHDPARVLKEIEAKRQIIARYEDQAALLANHMGGILTKYLVQELLEVVRALALSDDDHPDYKESWRP
ncbi:DUF6221 family protein [Streptomyces sp. NRRL S-920]|uniref:DUF6221 family protein n=1 Tax=Streptomyces sp. NRRL S-920 TaxID=1463921 RepID=UPI00068D2086|nr:DUF6221 family protein [Streptomyces sp. NRRL S-920]